MEEREECTIAMHCNVFIINSSFYHSKCCGVIMHHHCGKLVTILVLIEWSVRITDDKMSLN